MNRDDVERLRGTIPQSSLEAMERIIAASACDCRRPDCSECDPTRSKRLRDLERKLATESSIVDLASFCVNTHGWHDTATEADNEYVKLAVEYLDLRGLIVRHAKYKDWVKVKKEDADGSS